MTHTQLHTILQLPATERDAEIDRHRGEIESVLAGGVIKPLYLWLPEDLADWHPLTDPAQAAMVTEAMIKRGWEYVAASEVENGQRTYLFRLFPVRDVRTHSSIYTSHPVRATAEALACALAWMKGKESEGK